MGKVKVKKVVEKLPKLSGEPILIRFEHGDLRPGTHDLSSQMSGCYFEGNPSVQNNTQKNAAKVSVKRKLVVVVQNDQMTYLGSSDSPLNADSGDLQTFICVKRKKKLCIYEASPIVVSPYLAALPHLAVKESQVGPKTTEEKKSAAIDLVKAFGSKQKKLTLERLEKNKIDSQHMNESINKATENAIVSEEQLDNKDDTILSLVPPCNRDTGDIWNVYVLDDILTSHDLEEMEDVATEWLSSTTAQIKTWRESKMFSDYFFEMFKRLSPKQKQPHTRHVAKLVLYTQLLINLLKMKPHEIRKKVPSFPILFPLWLVEKAMDNFTSVNATGTRCRSEALRDKTSCYIMVLVLLANDLNFDVQLMSTSLQIHIKKLLTLAKAVGITITHNPTTKEYRGLLKFPLPQPVEKRGRGRKVR